MDQVVVASLVLLAVVVFFLASGVWVAISLLSAAIATLILFTPTPAGSLLASTMWDASWNWALTALPLFVWMGEILFRTRMASDMFSGLAPWVNALPGRLLHVNVLGCGIMAAVSGSSAVTAATIGRMSMPELSKRGYSEKMMIGTLAGSGTLGLLIPPSIVMIVYGVTAQQSVARLFIAGVLPGLLLIVLFMGFVAVWAKLNPDKMPPPEPSTPWRERIWNSRRLIPVVLLIIFVIGSIYGGFATPTEAAVIGVIGSLILAAAGRTLTWATFMESLMAATRTSCMIAFIIAAAACLTIAVGFVDIPRVLSSWVDSLELPATALIVVLGLFILVMGCFLEGISIIVLSASVMLPMVHAAGIDLIWFGIFITILIEAAQITPPVGFNLYVLQALTGRDIWRVTVATLPFFCLLMVLLVLITALPGIVTFLPSQMIAR
jgi:tripartite ATP-independent transporter DctM subunit